MKRVDVAPGDRVILRRAHPCGGTEWLVRRVGADIGLECLRCGRRVMLDREQFEARLHHLEAAHGEPEDA